MRCNKFSSKTGQQCRRKAYHGTYCWQHQSGGSPEKRLRHLLSVVNHKKPIKSTLDKKHLEEAWAEINNLLEKHPLQTGGAEAPTRTLKNKDDNDVVYIYGSSGTTNIFMDPATGAQLAQKAKEGKKLITPTPITPKTEPVAKTAALAIQPAPAKQPAQQPPTQQPPTQQPPAPVSPECQACLQELSKQRIIPSPQLTPQVKQQLLNNFKKWSLKNHPDKGGNKELFQKISNCVDIVAKQSKCDKPTKQTQKPQKPAKKPPQKPTAKKQVRPQPVAGRAGRPVGRAGRPAPGAMPAAMMGPGRGGRPAPGAMPAAMMGPGGVGRGGRPAPGAMPAAMMGPGGMGPGAMARPPPGAAPAAMMGPGGMGPGAMARPPPGAMPGAMMGPGGMGPGAMARPPPGAMPGAMMGPGGMMGPGRGAMPMVPGAPGGIGGLGGIGGVGGVGGVGVPGSGASLAAQITAASGRAGIAGMPGAPGAAGAPGSPTRISALKETKEKISRFEKQSTIERERLIDAQKKAKDPEEKKKINQQIDLIIKLQKTIEEIKKKTNIEENIQRNIIEEKKLIKPTPIPGPTGPPGPPGKIIPEPTGPTGPSGRIIPGPTGYTGPTGPPGRIIPGPTGVTGPTGPPPRPPRPPGGVTGATGLPPPGPRPPGPPTTYKNCDEVYTAFVKLLQTEIPKNAQSKVNKRMAQARAPVQKFGDKGLTWFAQYNSLQKILTTPRDCKDYGLTPQLCVKLNNELQKMKQAAIHDLKPACYQPNKIAGKVPGAPPAGKPGGPPRGPFRGPVGGPKGPPAAKGGPAAGKKPKGLVRGPPESYYDEDDYDDDDYDDDEGAIIVEGVDEEEARRRKEPPGFFSRLFGAPEPEPTEINKTYNTCDEVFRALNGFINKLPTEASDAINDLYEKKKKRWIEERIAQRSTPYRTDGEWWWFKINIVRAELQNNPEKYGISREKFKEYSRELENIYKEGHQKLKCQAPGVGMGNYLARREEDRRKKEAKKAMMMAPVTRGRAPGMPTPVSEVVDVEEGDILILPTPMMPAPSSIEMAHVRSEADKKKRLDELTGELKSVKRTIADDLAEEKKGFYEGKILALQGTLKSNQTQFEAINKEFQTKEELQDEVNDDLEEILDQRRELKNKIRNQEEEIIREKKDYIDAGTAAATKFPNYQRIKAGRQRKINELQTKYNKLSANEEQLQPRLTKLQDELVKLEKQLDKLKATIDDANEEILQYQPILDKLNNLISYIKTICPKEMPSIREVEKLLAELQSVQGALGDNQMEIDNELEFLAEYIEAGKYLPELYAGKMGDEVSRTRAKAAEEARMERERARQAKADAIAAESARMAEVIRANREGARLAAEHIAARKNLITPTPVTPTSTSSRRFGRMRSMFGRPDEETEIVDEDEDENEDDDVSTMPSLYTTSTPRRSTSTARRSRRRPGLAGARPAIGTDTPILPPTGSPYGTLRRGKATGKASGGTNDPCTAAIRSKYPQNNLGWIEFYYKCRDLKTADGRPCMVAPNPSNPTDKTDGICTPERQRRGFRHPGGRAPPVPVSTASSPRSGPVVPNIEDLLLSGSPPLPSKPPPRS